MNQERIATLLAAGIKAAQVATIVGISPSRISQLLQEESFKQLLDSKLAEANEQDIEELAITAKYHAAEHLLLDQITQLAPVSELRDVVGALKVVADRQDKAKTRMNPVPVQGATIHQNVIQLMLPSQAIKIPEIHIAGNNEVIGIGDNHLAPLSSQGVTSLFASRRAEQVEDRHARHLSSNNQDNTERISLHSDSADNHEGDENDETAARGNPEGRPEEPLQNTEVIELLKA